MSEIHIRQVRPEDATGLGPLLATLGYPAEEAQIAARLTRFLKGPEACLFVAEAEGQMVGFAAFQCLWLLHYEKALGRITSIAVSVDYQRKGVGKRLLDHIEAHARTEGYGRLEVTSADYRLGAHQFYQAQGYERASLRFIKAL